MPLSTVTRPTSPLRHPPRQRQTRRRWYRAPAAFAPPGDRRAVGSARLPTASSRSYAAGSGLTGAASRVARRWGEDSRGRTVRIPPPHPARPRRLQHMRGQQPKRATIRVATLNQLPGCSHRDLRPHAAQYHPNRAAGTSPRSPTGVSRLDAGRHSNHRGSLHTAQYRCSAWKPRSGAPRSGIQRRSHSDRGPSNNPSPRLAAGSLMGRPGDRRQQHAASPRNVASTASSGWSRKARMSSGARSVRTPRPMPSPLQRRPVFGVPAQPNPGG